MDTSDKLPYIAHFNFFSVYFLWKVLLLNEISYLIYKNKLFYFLNFIILLVCYVIAINCSIHPLIFCSSIHVWRLSSRAWNIGWGSHAAYFDIGISTSSRWFFSPLFLNFLFINRDAEQPYIYLKVV